MKKTLFCIIIYCIPFLINSCNQSEIAPHCADVDFDFIKQQNPNKGIFEMPDFEIRIKEGYEKDQLSYNVQVWQLPFNHCFRVGTYIKTEINKIEHSRDALFLVENSVIPGLPLKYQITVSCKNGKIWERVLVFS